ncbi:MAG: ATP-binding protein [Deltaproteobacteria bacterium]|nr:ATP-binding protein [Deltaproteobacteria bacterium]
MRARPKDPAGWREARAQRRTVRRPVMQSRAAEVAAVSGTFRVRDLPKPHPPGLLDVLIGPDADPDAAHRLRRRERVRILTRLVRRNGNVALRRARKKVPVAPRDADPLQWALDNLILERPCDPDELTESQALEMLRVRSWFEAVQGQLRKRRLELGPEEEQLRGRLRVLARVRPLLEFLPRNLEGEVDVVGRDPQLFALSDYLAAPPRAGGALESDPPLQLVGIGGMGKSTVVSAFLHLMYTTEPDQPWALLDLDGPELWRARPELVLRALAIQVAAQFPRHARVLRPLLEPGEEQRVKGGVRGGVSLLGKVLRDAGEGRPLLLVVDTWERVQRAGDAATADLLDLFYELSFALPLKLVLSGRASEDGVFARCGTSEARDLAHQRQHRIAGLEEAHARGLLRRMVQYRNPEAAAMLDQGLVTAILSQVGTSPFTLRLASKVLAKEGVLAVEESAREAAVQGVKDEYVRGFLFGRILDHLEIHPPELATAVRAVAIAGLAGMYVTPTIIESVLYPAIELANPPPARLVFDALAQERAVVRSYGGEQRYGSEHGALASALPEERVEYQEDLRQYAYAAAQLRPDKAAWLARVHSLALEQVPAESDVGLYHRLALAHEPIPSILKGVTRDSARRLEPFASDFPERAQALLDALRTADEVVVSAGVAEEARRIDAEDALADRAARFLEGGAWGDALTALAEVPPGERTPASRLHELEAQALDASGASEAAADAARRAVDAARTSGSALRLRLAARRAGDLLARAGKHLDAVTVLDSVASEPRLAGRPLEAGDLLLLRLRIAEVGQLWDAEALADELQRVRELLAQVGGNGAQAEPSLARGLAAAFGRVVPALLENGLNLAGFPAEESTQALGAALMRWDEELDGALSDEASVQRGLSRDWGSRLAATSVERLLLSFLDRTQDRRFPPDVAEGLRAVFVGGFSARGPRTTGTGPLGPESTRLAATGPVLLDFRDKDTRRVLEIMQDAYPKMGQLLDLSGRAQVQWSPGPTTKGHGDGENARRLLESAARLGRYGELVDAVLADPDPLVEPFKEELQAIYASPLLVE